MRAHDGPAGVLGEQMAVLIGRGPHFGDAALSERLECMHAAGLDHQVLSIPPHSLIVDDAATFAAHARWANDALGEICAATPTQFSYLANLPLLDADASQAEWERVRSQHGARGVIFNGKPLDWEGLEPVYVYLEEEQIPFFLHPCPPPHAPRVAGRDLGAISALYFPVEDADALLRLACGGVLERHPRVRVICPHLGGAVTFLLARIDHLARPSLPDGSPLPRPPSFYLKRQVLYDTVSLHDPAMRCALDTWGADRLVLGTDFPYIDCQGMRRIVQTIDAIPVSATERQDIRAANVLRWLAWSVISVPREL